MGILFGLFGVVFFYKLCKKLTINFVSTVAVLLFCTSPLFLSVGLFSLTDYFLGIFILASLALLTKETGKGTIYTIFSNIFSLKMFNKYAYQNWLQLFTLNFNWVLWIIAILGIIKGRISLIKNKTILRWFLQNIRKVKPIKTFYIP